MSNKEIASVDTPDPWMIAANGVFYLTFTLANRIEIWESPMMEDFFSARKSVVWKPEHGSHWAADIWAPELHWLAGKWYIYATASNPGVGNRGHRTIVLRSGNEDPMEASAWEFLGPVKGMPEQFSIDATVFSPNGQDLYLCWSGWPPEDYSDSQQNLYVSQMVSPEEVVDHNIMPPACISCADQPWERFNDNKRGINEGPTWLNLPNGAFMGIVYSGNASFHSEYAVGLLALVRPDADPLDPKSWSKRPQPLLYNEKARPGPYAPGHCSFLQSPQPGDNRVFCIYHGTANWGEGFRNRKGRVMVLDPADFGPHARPVCCSHGAYGQALGNQYPGAPPSGQPGGSGQGQGQGQDTLASIGQKFEQYAGKAPAPVQKALDRFRKFL